MINKRIITEEEVAWLHVFCKKKDIKYIDLRIELVDHLCALVEARWATHPQEDFKTAFYAVYKGFGIFGFMQIAEEHEKTMNKRYWREIWSYFKSWITPPKVVLTALLFSLIYLVASLSNDSRFMLWIGSLVIYIFSLGISIWQYRRNLKILNGEQNLYMAGPRTYLVWFGYFIFQLFFNTGPRTRELFMSNPWPVAIALLLLLLFCAANYQTLEKAKNKLLDLKAVVA
jgi:hypothetical protein